MLGKNQVSYSEVFDPDIRCAIYSRIFKVGQTARDEILLINTGQMLSIPFVLFGVYLVFSALRKSDSKKTPEKEPLV